MPRKGGGRRKRRKRRRRKMIKIKRKGKRIINGGWKEVIGREGGRKEERREGKS